MMIRLLYNGLVFALAIFACSANDVANEATVEAVVIQQTMNRSGPEALLITDAADMRRVSELLLDNPKSAIHACGYHWLISFFHSDGSITSIVHNEECEEYSHNNGRVHRILKEYFESALNAPTHYLINIAVPSSIGLSDVKRTLDDDNNRVVWPQGESARLPAVVVKATVVSGIPSDRDRWEIAKAFNRASAEEKVQSGVEVVQNTGLVESLDRLRYPRSSFGGSKISDTVERKLFLNYSASTQEVPEPAEGIEFDFEDPPEFYTIQLVSESAYSEELKHSLLEKLPPILDIALFPGRFQGSAGE